MVVLGAIASGGQESLEFRIGDRCAIDEEACDVDLVAMEPPRGIFPGILHIDAWIVSAFNFGTAYLKIVLAFRNANHAGRRGLCQVRRRDLDDCLGRGRALWRAARERAL